MCISLFSYEPTVSGGSDKRQDLLNYGWLRDSAQCFGMTTRHFTKLLIEAGLAHPTAAPTELALSTGVACMKERDGRKELWWNHELVRAALEKLGYTYQDRSAKANGRRARRLENVLMKLTNYRNKTEMLCAENVCGSERLKASVKEVIRSALALEEILKGNGKHAALALGHLDAAIVGALDLVEEEYDGDISDYLVSLDFLLFQFGKAGRTAQNVWGIYGGWSWLSAA